MHKNHYKKSSKDFWQHQLIHSKLLTTQEENELIKIIYENVTDDTTKKIAINKLITANLKLVGFIAKKYTNRGLDFMDLVQEGNFGLIKAVKHFNYRLGYKFVSYAHSCIKRSITRALITKSKIIRIPIEALKILKKVTAASNQLRQSGFEPTLKNIAKYLNLKEIQILEIMTINSASISLNTTIGESSQTISDLIADSSNIDPNKLSIDEELTEWLEELPPKEAKILKMRFGIGINHDHTLAEIGLQLGVSRERIRQLETKALQKLRQIGKAANY